MVYRESHMKAAGFDSFPKDTDGFLKLCKALKEKGTPPGFALGNATGDGNTWAHWLLWAFGGKVVDKDNKVVIDSPETLKALEYVKELYGTFVPGTLSWLDPNNNKAFLDGQISLTNNGISVYYAAKTSQRSEAQGNGGGHQPRQHADRAGGPADRVPALLQPDDLQVHQVPEGGEGVPALHDGGGAGRPVGAGGDRLRHAGAARLREEPDLDGGSEAHAVPQTR